VLVYEGVAVAMNTKWVIFVVLGAFLFLLASPGSGAVNTRDIEKVRSKSVLEDEDFQIIDNFVAEAVDEMVKTRDLSSIAKVRTVILQHNSSGKKSAQAQYAAQFSESAYKYISSAFEKASELRAESRRFVVTVNLLILIDNLQNHRLADLAVRMLRDENTVIRYWAVRSVTNPGIAAGADGSKLAQRVAEQLKGIVNSSGPEVISLIAEFAGDVNVMQAEDLLLRIADMRIKKYADWAVDYERLDETILKSLCKKVSSGAGSKPLVAQRFAQLYSYVMQRYIKDLSGGNFLSEKAKQQTVSVLVEIEKACIGKLLTRPRSTIKKAIERGGVTALLLEHSRLLGGETEPGELARKLRFHYGVSPDGRERTAPLPLPERPATKALGPNTKD
jgi:hypothetical protein